MPANLAIYLPGAVPTAESIRAHPSVESADIDVDANGARTQYRLVINGVCVRITPMERGRVPGHINGFIHFVDNVPPTPHSKEVRRKLRTVKNVLGTVIEPDVDAEGRVDDFLYDLAKQGDALVFMSDSVFSSDGIGLVGRCIGMDRRDAR